MTQELVGAYDHRVVALSIVIAVAGAYGAFALGERLTAARGRTRGWWLIGTATPMAAAIWSMHYTAMLAFELPVPTRYDWPTALLSFVVALSGSFVGFAIVGRREFDGRGMVAGGLFFAAGIVGLHYLSMASMRAPVERHYSAPVVVLSMVVALVFSVVAVWLMFRVDASTAGRYRRQAVSALIMGAAAISGMHFTGMAAATFTPSVEIPDTSHAVRITLLGTLGISVVTLMVSAIALVTSLVDRLWQQRALLDELFEQAPQAVALTTADNRVVRVNREFTRIFGYTPTEIHGRRLTEQIVPDELRDAVEAAVDRVAQGQRVGYESVRRRKDGTQLRVSVLGVPVSVPGGQVALYAIYRDITEQKRAEEMQQTFSQRLIETQEAERRRVARELHDELGQALTAIKMNLQAIQHAPGTSLPERPLNDSMAVIDHALQRVRDLSLDLRPSMLDDLGLLAALQWYVDREAARAGLAAEFAADRLEAEVPPALGTACFRIAQETLTNIVRHARARTVWVEMRRREETLHLLIRDDGIGFDVEVARSRARADVNLGLLGMQERAFIVGGQIDIRSTPGRGTEVEARFPLRPPGPGR